MTDIAPPPQSPADHAGDRRHWLWPALLTALAYFVAGELALKLLAIPPGYAAPIYPAAGLALVAVLVYGHGVLPGVVLGSYLVNLQVSAGDGLLSPTVLLLPLLSAV